MFRPASILLNNHHLYSAGNVDAQYTEIAILIVVLIYVVYKIFRKGKDDV